MHDFHHATAEALPELLRRLKACGFKVVHVVTRAPVTTLPKYDEMLMQQEKLSVNKHPTGIERRSHHRPVERCNFGPEPHCVGSEGSVAVRLPDNVRLPVLE